MIGEAEANQAFRARSSEQKRQHVHRKNVLKLFQTRRVTWQLTIPFIAATFTLRFRHDGFTGSCESTSFSLSLERKLKFHSRWKSPNFPAKKIAKHSFSIPEKKSSVHHELCRGAKHIFAECYRESCVIFLTFKRVQEIIDFPDVNVIFLAPSWCLKNVSQWVLQRTIRGWSASLECRGEMLC